MIGINICLIFVGNVAPKKSRLECKIRRFTPMCISLCHAQIIYLHSTSLKISRACIYFGIHEILVSNGTCRESLDVAYQCVANEVMKIPTPKNYATVIAANEQILADYLLKAPSNSEGHHLTCSSLEVVMDKFSICPCPNCYNFVSSCIRFS